ncbi:MAG: PAS domain-containing protein [Pseudomonadota bacterium]
MMRLIYGIGSKIAPPEQHRIDCTAADFPGCRDLTAYWQALRGSQIAPARSAFDPRGVERTLNMTFIAERVAASVLRIRVAGSHLDALLGMDVRGMPVTAFFEAPARDQFARLCKPVFDEPASACLDLVSPGGLARPELRARMLLLPMIDGFGEMTRLVGCLETIGREGRLPRRFAIQRSQVTQLSGTWPRADAAAFAKPRYDQPATPAMTFGDTAQPAFRSARVQRNATRQVRQLRLVVDNAV